jgi:hypothetical protein
MKKAGTYKPPQIEEVSSAERDVIITALFIAF